MIEEMGPGLWTVSAEFSLAGAAFGTRMTVVRIGEGGLGLIAPIEIDDALAHGYIQLAWGIGVDYGVTPGFGLEFSLAESVSNAGHRKPVFNLF